ncbi:MAG: hypothetical protein ABW196_03035 [Solirubrobacterales bacterium]
MKSIQVGGFRFVVVAAVGLAVAALSYVDAQGSDASPIAASERHEAEAEIARSLVVTRLEDALGDDFGGVWFEPASGQLHVGVPTAANRRDAETTAASAGVAEIVTETPVGSTWEELEAAQARWAGRMADLFERAEVTTSLRPQDNALAVELGASVTDSRRAALERAAAAEDVNVLIEATSMKGFRAVKQARCATFVPAKAKCDPTIVAGVTIIPNTASGSCTAGPAVIPKDASTAAKATERRILTAGHCIHLLGQNTWYALNRKVEPEKQLIGLAGNYLNEHAADIGLISMDPMSKWRQAGFIPVNPAIALWNAKAETEPIPVVASTEPTVGLESCISGQISGKLCGKVVTTKKTLKDIENMAEVEVANTQPGDSGAPWYSKSYAESSAGMVEGVHVGQNSATGTAIFEPVQIGLEKLKEKKGDDYELLRQNNEERKHPVVKADKYPTTASAKGASEDQFTAFGSTLKCAESEFDGELTQVSTALELTPGYKSCTMVGLPVVFTSNGCKYKFTPKEETAEGQFSSEADLVCPAGKAGVQFSLYASHANQTSGTALCTLTVPPQTGLKSGTLKNSAGDIVIEKVAIEAIKVKIHRNSFLCVSSGTENETPTGVYHLNKAVTIAGTSGGSPVDIDIGGG